MARSKVSNEIRELTRCSWCYTIIYRAPEIVHDEMGNPFCCVICRDEWWNSVDRQDDMVVVKDDE